MSDYELGINMGALAVFSLYLVRWWLELKYTKQTAREYEEINNHLKDITNKLESRG